MIWLAIWVVGVVVIQIGGHRALLRDEPTSHGQIVGRSVLFLTCVFWSLLVAASYAWWRFA